MTNVPVVKVFVTFSLGVLLAVSALAQSDSRVVYGGSGTNLNGTPLYTAAPVSNGDTVTTAIAGAKLSVGQAQVELAPSTRFSVADGQMGCGTATITATGPFTLQVADITVQTTGGKYQVVNDNGSVQISAVSGTVEVKQGAQTQTVTAGHSLTAAGTAECSAGGQLPDAPSSSASERIDTTTRISARPRKLDDAPAGSARRGGFAMDNRVADRSYWAVTGAMFSSSIVGAELTARCIEQGKCSRNLDGAPHNRALVYGVGLPADAGVAYLTYYLKRKRSRFWFVPAAVVTAGSTYMAIHSAHWLGK